MNLGECQQRGSLRTLPLAVYFHDLSLTILLKDIRELSDYKAENIFKIIIITHFINR